uniref:Dynein heavy chain coiled coil stalk domain-containing protein n=1 Tax=Megaselia scalaris TaxID=36166 RepID=T1GNX2_MEGSC
MSATNKFRQLFDDVSGRNPTVTSKFASSRLESVTNLNIWTMEQTVGLNENVSTFTGTMLAFITSIWENNWNFSSLKEKQIKYQEGVQSLPKIKERIQELSKKLEEISSEIRSLEQQKEPLRKKLENSIKEKDSTKQKNKEILNSMRNSLQNIKTTNNDIQRLTNDLAALEELNLSNAIQNLKESFKKVEKDLSEKLQAFRWELPFR